MKVQVTMLELSDGRSDKFYNVFTAAGKMRGIVHWGRRGTRGTSQNVTWTEACDRLAEKRKKGYAVLQTIEFEYSDSWDVESLLNAAHSVSRNKARATYKDQEAIFVW